MTGAAHSAEIVERLRTTLDACAAGELPANVALMRLIMAAIEPLDVLQAIEAAQEHRKGQPGQETARLVQLERLWEETPDSWEIVKSVLASVRHDEAASEYGIARQAAAFDDVARLHGDAGSALYALGRADLLARATDEIADVLHRWKAFEPGDAVLEIGCGSGRVAERLARDAGYVVGLDVSSVMLAQASRRCAACRNVLLVQTSGRDLSAIGSEKFHLVCAVDSFPYIVSGGPGLAATYVHEAARVLVPGGGLVIFNYSYRGDEARDLRDIEELSDRAGLALMRRSRREFALWDGCGFHLQRVR